MGHIGQIGLSLPEITLHSAALDAISQQEDDGQLALPACGNREYRVAGLEAKVGQVDRDEILGQDVLL